MGISYAQGQTLQTMSTDFGSDIKLGDNYDPIITATGEPVIIAGPASVAQDVRLAIQTPKGGLFYDPEFGSDVVDYVHDDCTDTNLRHLEIDLADSILSDPRVEYNSVSISAAGLVDGKIQAGCSFICGGVRNQYRIVVGQTVEVV